MEDLGQTDEGPVELPIEQVDPRSIFATITERAALVMSEQREDPVSMRETRLLGMDREKFDKARAEIEAHREAHQGLATRIEQTQIAALEFIPAEHADKRDAAKAALRSNLQEMHQVFLAAELSHQNTLDMATGLALEAFFDTNTPLFARKAMIRVCGEVLLNEEKKQLADPTYEPVQVYFEMGDGMLFHAGNEIRSASGFDNALRGEARAQIAVAKYFSSEYNPYQHFEDQADVFKDPDFQRFVVEVPSNKIVFDALAELTKKEGNSLEYYEVRVNAGGGDEFLRVYNVKGEDSDAMLTLARELTIGITRSQVLTPEHDVSKGEARELSDKELDRRLEIRSGLKTAVKELGVKWGPDSGLLRQFMEFYGEFTAAQVSQEVFQNPTVDLCFDMAVYERQFENSERLLPNMDDAIMHFVAGRDAEGNRLQDGKGEPIYGFYTESGRPDSERIDAYAQNLSDRVRSIIRPENLGDVQLVAETVRDLVTEDMFTSYVDYLNDQVNAVAKPIKKYQVLLDALLQDRHNPKALMAIGATVATGRPKFVDLSNVEQAELAITLIQDFKNKCDANPDDEFLQKGMDYWAKIQREYIRTPLKNGKLPAYSSIDDIDYDKILEEYHDPSMREKRRVQRKQISLTSD